MKPTSLQQSQTSTNGHQELNQKQADIYSAITINVKSNRNYHKMSSPKPQKLQTSQGRAASTTKHSCANGNTFCDTSGSTSLPMKQQIVSVAKYLSPTRSHVSQHVKPLFANRERNSWTHYNSVVNSVLPKPQTQVKTSFQPNVRMVQAVGMRRPGLRRSALTSFTNDSDTYEILTANIANEEAGTPSNRSTSIEPYPSNNNQKLVEDNTDNNVANNIIAVEDSQQKNAAIHESNEIKGGLKTFSDKIITEPDQNRQNHEVDSIYQMEPIAQEMPILAKKSKTSSVVCSNAKALQQKQRTSRQHRAANAASANTALLLAQHATPMMAGPPQFTMKNHIMNMHLVAKSDTSQSSGVETSSSNVILKQERHYLHGKGSQQSRGRRTGNRAGSSHGGSSTNLAGSAERSGKVGSNAALSGSQQKKKCSRRPLESNRLTQGGVTNASDYVAKIGSVKSGENAQQATPITAKNQTRKKESIMLLYGGSRNQSKQQPQQQSRRQHSKITTSSSNGIISPVRNGETYHLGVLHQKRKASAKGRTSNMTPSGAVKTHNYVTLQTNSTNVAKTPVTQQTKTISNPLPFAYHSQSLSLKNFVEARNFSNNQVAFRPPRKNGNKTLRLTHKHMAVACPPDISMNTALAHKDINNVSQLSQRATFQKQRSEDQLLVINGINSAATTPISSKVNKTTNVGVQQKQMVDGVMRCQLNKGIRKLLKSKSQIHKKVKRQPLGEVNSNQVGKVDDTQSSTLKDQMIMKQMYDNSDDQEEVEQEAHINILVNENNYTDNPSSCMINNLFAPLQGDDDSAPMPEMPTCKDGSTSQCDFSKSKFSVLPKKLLNQRIQQKISNYEEVPSVMMSDLSSNLLTVRNTATALPVDFERQVKTNLENYKLPNFSSASPTSDFQSTFDWKQNGLSLPSSNNQRNGNLPSQPTNSSNNDYYTTAAADEQTPPSLHLHQSSNNDDSTPEASKEVTNKNAVKEISVMNKKQSESSTVMFHTQDYQQKVFINSTRSSNMINTGNHAQQTYSDNYESILIQQNCYQNTDKQYHKLYSTTPQLQEEQSMVQVDQYKVPLSVQSTSMLAQPTATIQRSIRRKRSCRAASSHENKSSNQNKNPSIISGSNNSILTSTPVVTLNLALALPQSTSEQPKAQVTSQTTTEGVADGVAPSSGVVTSSRRKPTSFNEQNRRITSTTKKERVVPVAHVTVAALQQNPSPFTLDHSVSFAAAAEDCQGGIRDHSIEQEGIQKDKTLDISPEQATNIYYNEGMGLFSNDGNAAMKVFCFSDQFDQSQAQNTTNERDRQVGQQQSDLVKINIAATATAEIQIAIKGTNFDEILERRDLEVTTKSSPLMSVEDPDETTKHENQISATSRPSMPQSLFGNNNLTVKPLEMKPYLSTKQYQTINSEARDNRTSVRKPLLLQKSRSQIRNEKIITPAGGRLTLQTNKQASRNSNCLSPSHHKIQTTKSRVSETRMATATRRLQTTLRGRNQQNTAVAYQEAQAALKGSQKNLAAAYKTTSQIRKTSGEENQSVSGPITKSHSQVNSSMRAQRNRLNQKLFAVDTNTVANNNMSLTPRKQHLDLSHRASNFSQQKLIRRQKSNDRVSNNADTTSQGTRFGKSPGQKSQGALSVHQPIKHVLKSTKKLTQFKEFAITPATGVQASCHNAFISPQKLKKLERKHGVNLLGGVTPNANTVNVPTVLSSSTSLLNGGSFGGTFTTNNAVIVAAAVEVDLRSDNKCGDNTVKAADYQNDTHQPTVNMLESDDDALCQLRNQKEEARVDEVEQDLIQDAKLLTSLTTNDENNQVQISQKDQELLQNNDAMDAYMRDLCNKYF